MNLLRLMLTACVLLAQAWPAQAVVAASAKAEGKACAEGCCAWLAEAGMSVCSCDDTSAPAAPAGLPPLSGRELVPQVVWVEARETALLKAAPRTEAAMALASRRGREAVASSHVRLPVLFCAFLN